MVENVKKFGAELDVKLLGEGTKAGVLDEGSIELVEAWSNDGVAAGVAEVGVAGDGVERGEGETCGIYIRAIGGAE